MRSREAFWSAASNFCVALAYLFVWIKPLTLGHLTAREYGISILLEPAVIMMGLAWDNPKWLGISLEQRFWQLPMVACVSLLYAIVMSYSFTLNLWPLTGLAVLMVNKTIAFRSAPQRPGRRSKLAILAWWGTLFLAALIPFPELGVTEIVVKQQRLGMQVDRFHSFFAQGVLYFAFLGIMDMGVIDEIFGKEEIPS